MRRVSTVFSKFALAAMTGLLLLPRGVAPAPDHVATHKPDFSAFAIDPMPVGTARQMARIKRTKTERKI